MVCLFIVMFPFNALVAASGTVGGNGCCYSDGRYCGCRHQGPKGSSCDCLEIAPGPGPNPFDGLDIIAETNSANIVSVTLPDVGVPSMGIELWNGTSFTNVTVLEPNVEYVFPGGGVSRFRITGVTLADDVDLSNTNIFPLQLAMDGGGNFSGAVEAFSSGQPIEVFLDRNQPQLTLFWFGGRGPFVIQYSDDLQSWNSLPATDSRSTPIVAAGNNRFFRIKGDGSP